MSLLPHLCDIDPKITYNQHGILVIDNFYQDYEAYKCISVLDSLKGTSGIIYQLKLANLILAIITPFLPTFHNENFDVLNWNVYKLDSINPNFKWDIKEKGFYTVEHLEIPKMIQDSGLRSFYSLKLFLNEGGEFVFPTLNLSFKSKEGRIIIFDQSLKYYNKMSDNELYFLTSDIYYNPV